jgi:hypothetical protein
MTKRNQTHFFATRADLEPVLQLIESNRPLTYALIRLYKTPDYESYDSLLRLDRLGTSSSGQHNLGDDFLIVERNNDIRIRSVIQREGGIHYFVDQEFNPKSICFRPGGIYERNNLVSGRIGTASDDSDSLELYKTFAKAVTKGFKKVGNYKVGPEALILMNQGMRMVTMGVDEPPEYDLKRN